MPFVTRGEALVAARAFKATGRKSLPTRADGSCPLLKDATGGCLIYNDRPFACRTHFCAAAGGPYARREVIELIRRLETTNCSEGSRGSQPLPVAVAAVLADL